jgi:RNA polymerase sigma-70 factor (ECF subfamily)
MTDWKGCNDTGLMAEIRKGTHPAFACLVERHAPRYYRLAFRLLQHRQEAEDVVQEAFIRLWERPSAWDACKNVQFTTWFYRVVVNGCLDYQRRRRTVSGNNLLDTLPDSAPDQEEILGIVQEQRILRHALQMLPERQRTALVLCFYEGLSNQQAADIMGVELKALQSLVMRAKMTLKERMKIYA